MHRLVRKSSKTPTYSGHRKTHFRLIERRKTVRVSFLGTLNITTRNPSPLTTSLKGDQEVVRSSNSLLSLALSPNRNRMTVSGCTFSSDNIVVKSPNDRRLYRYIELPNGLCALLVHDPEIYSGGDVIDDDSRKQERSAVEVEDEDDYEDDDEDDDNEDEEEEVSEEDDEENEEDEGKKGASEKKVKLIFTHIYVDLMKDNNWLCGSSCLRYVHHCRQLQQCAWEWAVLRILMRRRVWHIF